ALPAPLSPQYEDAFSSRRLQNWSVPRPGRQRPSLREGSTQIIADDRGHLLPTVPRSQASPWGTFVGTWEMPLRIPPARLDLTSRSAAAATRLLGWIHQPTTLTRARNGLWTEITGKVSDPHWGPGTLPLGALLWPVDGVHLPGLHLPGLHLPGLHLPGSLSQGPSPRVHLPGLHLPGQLHKPAQIAVPALREANAGRFLGLGTAHEQISGVFCTTRQRPVLGPPSPLVLRTGLPPLAPKPKLLAAGLAGCPGRRGRCCAGRRSSQAAALLPEKNIQE
uniref:Protein Flattop n=1 Tax=Strix occidentalis caurina TaxID=311401 RepID=A0A8D0FQ17_STROC